MIKVILSNPFIRQSYKKAFLLSSEKTGEFLIGKYTSLMRGRRDYYANLFCDHSKSNIVWFCWLQGIEQAPPVVKVCYRSMCHHLTDRVIKVIDQKNWNEYVNLPDYIVQKWEKRQIPPAHFSDLLRIQLLIKYGGSWIDSTVLCTGVTSLNEREVQSFFDADLFMFQYTNLESNQWGSIDNWFITSYSNNVVLMVLRDLLYAYWKDYDCLIDYFCFHHFFLALRDVYPDEIASMPYGNGLRCLDLVKHWGEVFDQDWWDKLTSEVCFHKLAHEVKRKVMAGTGNYYHHVIAVK